MRAAALVIASLLFAVDARAQGQSLLTTQAPAVSTGTLAWELGAQMSSDVPGRITAIRYYRLAGDVGPHVGHVWSAAGALLATVPIPAQTAAGWQEVTLLAPVPVSAGMTWAVSVDSATGTHYAFTPGLNPLTNGHLKATDGLYGPTGVFPVSTTPTSYYRDVRFVPDTPPTITISADGTAGGYTALTAGFATGAYTLTVTLRDAAGAVVAASSAVTVP